MTSQPLTAEAARRLHWQASTPDQMVHWAVCHDTVDFGDRFVARPHLVQAGRVEALRCHLLADTLEELRALLPPGLYCLGRQPGDDPVIVEVWL